MEITYKNIHDIGKEELQELYLSVEWSSGHYPDKLVGLICAMDDGIMTAYIHHHAKDGKLYLHDILRTKKK